MKAKRFKVSFADIKNAKSKYAALLPPTPLVFSSWLSSRYRCKVYLKLENMQPIGSFKIRGAISKISQLTLQEKRKGVIAASAGNHAQGVAWASAHFGAKALIVMPKEAPLIKVENTKNLGAEVCLDGANFEEAYQIAKSLAKKTGRVFIPAYHDEQVIAGQGTVGLEILEQLPDVDFVIGAVGGGGLLVGTAIALKELRPQTRVIGSQAVGCDAMVQSFRKGRAIQLKRVQTFADGAAVPAANRDLLRLAKEYIDQILEADDEAIASAVLTLLEKAKTVTEGAGALPLAILDQLRTQIKGKQVCLIIGGGNIDVNLIARIIDRGLTLSGRRIRVNVWISDKPGSLNRLTELLAHNEVNILQAIHDRSEPLTKIDQTEVALTLETKGPKHSAEVIRNLKAQVLRVELVV